MNYQKHLGKILKVVRSHILIIGDDLKGLSLLFQNHNITLIGANNDPLLDYIRSSHSNVNIMECDLNNWIILSGMIKGATALHSKYDVIILDSKQLNNVTLQRIIPIFIDNASDNIKIFHVLGDDKSFDDEAIQKLEMDCEVLNNINILPDNKKWVRDNDFIDNLYTVISKKI